MRDRTIFRGDVFSLVVASAVYGGIILGFIVNATAQTNSDSLSKTASQGPATLQFRDVALESGLIPVAVGLQAHGAGWGDVDHDGWPDLYVGTFHYEGTQGGLLLRNNQGHFERDPQGTVEISSRATGVLLVDLDNDGDLDLYVASMPAPANSRLATRLGYPLRGCTLFENLGEGRFRDVSADNGACPTEFGGRSATVADFNGDGLLDLLVGEDPIPGYNGSSTRRSRLFRNQGGLQFIDVTDESRIPQDAAGLGVAAGDVNQDGWPDLFLASTLGNLLMLNDQTGRFVECRSARDTFAWPEAKGDDMICGVVLADVDRDGKLDVVIGQHFSQPWVEPVANRLYLQREAVDGQPTFEDVTESVGMVALPMKAPHVEVQDFDNDGFVDISTSIVMFAAGHPHPVIFHNQQEESGDLEFRAPALSVNDFPTDADRMIRRSASFFDKMLSEGKVLYSAPAPTADFDRDGRLDIFIGSWWSQRNSLLLKNETISGNWLDVAIEGRGRMNRMGIGARIEVYEKGRVGEPESLLGMREIASGFGYASSQEAIAHFGLGERSECDVLVRVPFDGTTVQRTGVTVNQRLIVQVNQ